MIKRNTLKYKNKIHNNTKKNRIKGGKKRIDTRAEIYLKIVEMFNEELSENLIVYELNRKESEQLIIKLNQPIPLSCKDNERCKKLCGTTGEPTYMDVFKLIDDLDKPKKVIIFGGSVRDYLQSNYDINALNDIDINFKLDYHTLIGRLQNGNRDKENCYRIEKDDSKRYILFGNSKNSEYLEGFQITDRAYNKYILESRCNSLGILIDNSESNTKFFLIDFFRGFGIKDAETKIYCASFLDSEINTEKLRLWVQDPKKRNILWRMLKFLLRDYTIETNTAVTIYNYWYSDSIGRREPTGHSLQWNKIWNILPIDTVNYIFGKDGLLQNHLKQLERSRSSEMSLILPYEDLYEHFINHLELNNLIIKKPNGMIEAPPIETIIKIQSRFRSRISRSRSRSTFFTS